MLSRRPVTGAGLAGLRRVDLHVGNIARARMHLRDRGSRRRMRTAHRAVDFRARFDASSAGLAGNAASPGGDMRLRAIQRAVAGCRSDRTFPSEIAPLAGRRVAAVLLLHRLDAIRHATAVRGIVPPDHRRGSRERRPDPRAHNHTNEDDAAPVPVAGTVEKSRAHRDAGAPEESRRISGIGVVAGPGRPVHGRIQRPPP